MPASTPTPPAGARLQSGSRPHPTRRRVSAGSGFGWSRPRRVDLPETAEGLTGSECFAILEQLGLVDGDPPKAVEPEPVELVLTLDHEQVRELENVRMARTPGEPATTPIEALPSLDQRFGGADIGRNDPCPCGSGKKYKRCHGR